MLRRGKVAKQRSSRRQALGDLSTPHHHFPARIGVGRLKACPACGFIQILREENGLGHRLAANDENRAFALDAQVKRYRIDNAIKRMALTGQQIDPFGYGFVPFGYAAGQILAKAVTETKSLDHDKIAKYIHANSFDTVAGQLKFGKDGEWAEPRTVFSQFQGVVPNDVAQFRDGDIAETVAHILNETGLAPNRLELEITESLLINDTEEVLDKLNRLRQLGVSIAMDDFGTGYSSLSYLARFPFNKIKIDRSFIRNMAQDSVVNAIVKTIASCHARAA